MKTRLARPFLLAASLLAAIAVRVSAQTVVEAEAIVTLDGSSSAGSTSYDVKGGITTLVPALPGGSSALLRSEGGTVKFLNTASADTATFVVHGGPGNGGRFGAVEFRDSSTAAAATITNQAGVLGPNFQEDSPASVDGFGGETIFYDSAKAGTAQITNEGESTANGGSNSSGGITDFRTGSSADHGTFVTQGASSVDGLGGIVEFEGTATADSGTFTNFGGASSPYSNGRTLFSGTSTAGHGSFTNKGGDVGFLLTGGTTEFAGSSTAANGTFVNEGGVGGTYPHRGATQFFDTASAGEGTFINKPGAGGGGVEFYEHSTAANGTFLNDSDVDYSSTGGEFLFKDDSTADHGHFTIHGLYGGYITFKDRATAAQGTYVIEPGAYNARILFYASSTADEGTIEIGGEGYLQFFESSTAGHATIVLRGNGTAGGNPVTGGSIGQFSTGTTAGNAAITVMGAEQDGGIGGQLYFASATAGDATITVNGASVTTNGAYAGSVLFGGGSHAGNATLIVNGGTNGGAGGVIHFGGATGDQARIVVNVGGTIDVNGGVSVGSIEGAGSIFASALTVGNLNTDTTFSGVISNGYYTALGALTKEGAGTLTLSGANAYTGLTTIDAGTLAVNGSIVGGVQVNAGATLKGSGTIGGTVTVAPGGIVSPGNSPGTLTVAGLVLDDTSVLTFDLGTTSDLIVVNGDLTVDGVLNIVNAGGLMAGGAYDLFHWTGTLTDHGLTIGSVPPGFNASDFSFEFVDGRARVAVAPGSGPPPPAISTQPLATSVTSGTTARFTAAASGSGLTYRWQRQAAGETAWSDLAEGGAYSGVTAAALDVAPTTAMNGDQFRVVIASDNGASATSMAATLTVAAAPPPTRLVNLSTRALVETGTRVLIVGFVVDGPAPKQVLVRAIGPGLTGQGVTDILAHAKLELHQGDTILKENAGWSSADNAADIAQAATDTGAFELAEGSGDAAVLVTLDPGPYTAVVRGADGGTGVAMAEIYEIPGAAADERRLINISGRAQIGAADGTLIAGFVIAGDTPKKVLIRAVGPGLVALGVSDAATALKLTLFHGPEPIKQNEGWDTVENAADVATAMAHVGAFALAAGSGDSALLIDLDPGLYTVHATGVHGATGVALIEVYQVSTP